jgi:2,5-furandicarboxylate decarboxylase 1
MNLAQRNLTDIQSYIKFLEANGDLIRVRSEVDAEYELAGIAKKYEGRKVILFEKVKDSDYPVLMGLYWNRDILSRIFDTPSDELPFALANDVKAWHASPIEPVIVERGPANEVIEQEIDLYRLPIPVHSELDGGRYLTSSVVIARDPDTGVRNLSVHRMMVTGKNRFTLLLEELGHVMDYYKRAEAKGQPLEITVNNGIDIPFLMAGASPASAAPMDTDETGIACAMRGEAVQLLDSQTVSVEGIADAQFVIEGKILPLIREDEGPYAEVTGYYAGREPRWVCEVTAITRRKDAVFHSILSGKEVRNAYALGAGAGAFEKVHSQIPEVTAVHFSDACVPYHVVVQIDKTEEGIQQKAIRATFDSLAFAKMVTVVDTDVDVYSVEDVEWAVATRCQFENDLMLIDGIGHRLNPSVVDDKWTRLGIDATVPLPREEKFERAKTKDVNLDDYDIEGV